jgi:hypothetical protein
MDILRQKFLSMFRFFPPIRIPDLKSSSGRPWKVPENNHLAFLLSQPVREAKFENFLECFTVEKDSSITIPFF